MPDPMTLDASQIAALEAMAASLTEKYGSNGRTASDRLRAWLTGAIPYAEPGWIARLLAPERVALVFDSFWQVLPFGTGGRRGRVGYGSNRMNATTVALTIQGHADFIRRRFPGRRDLAVVVANDVRVFNDVAGTYGFLGGPHPLLGASSRSFAKLAAQIYAGNGITAYLPDPTSDSATLSTPELSFLITRLGAAGGVNMSASHNPPDDNGVKVYDEHGSQPVAPEDQLLLDVMAQVEAVQTVAFEKALAAGTIRPVPGALHATYVQANVKLYGAFYAPQKAPPIVYTPLCGVGLGTAGDVLRALGFPVLTPPAEGPDGSFAVIPFRSPNPEVPQSTAPARAFADQHGSGIVLSSDPDADRVGLEVKLDDGSWYHCDGNQIAAILGYALMLDAQGPRRAGLVIETLVTTKLLGRIAARRGDSDVIDDLLVGFKYVADVLKRLRAEGRYRDIRRRPEELVLAAEESHGVIGLPDILDKDSAPACMFLAGLYQRLAAQGKNLLDYYVSILEEVGGFDNVNRSIMMAGAAGMERKDRIMAWLRESPPRELAGAKVTRVVDYWDERAFGPLKSASEQLPRNVVQLFTERFVVTVRPSGTEPKLKLYCEILPGISGPPARGRALLGALRAEADRIAREVYNALLAPLGVSLGEAGLLLTDLIELDRKVEFEREILPALAPLLRGRKFATFDNVLDWLRERSRALLPGADALPALRGPLAPLAASLGRELPGDPVVGALQAFAEGHSTPLAR
jgi:phosphoglucomutase/phosphomannomutase